jgi:hypothetical protein
MVMLVDPLQAAPEILALDELGAALHIPDWYWMILLPSPLPGRLCTCQCGSSIGHQKFRILIGLEMRWMVVVTQSGSFHCYPCSPGYCYHFGEYR